MKLLIKFPTRGRPDVFKSTLESYYSHLSGKHDYEFVITMDVDDQAMNCQPIHEWFEGKPNLSYCYGENKSKIQAVNANMQDRQFDVLLLASDDMLPQIHGYDDIIITKMQEHYPDNCGALHFNDGRTGKDLCTLSIMGKPLYDHFGYIYHFDFRSLFCDQEYHDVCYNMNKMTYIDQVIIKHAWVDATGQDHLHKYNESFYQMDQRTYNTRKARGFPRESINNYESERAIIRDPRRRHLQKKARRKPMR